MIALACVLLPLAYAAVSRFLPRSRVTEPAVALVNLALAGSLPWLGGSFGDWLLPDPVAAHVMVLTGFAWLISCGATALDGQDEPGASAAALVGCVNLALLGGSPVLTVLAAGGGAFAAIHALRPAAPLRIAATSASALAVLGAALLSNGPPATSLGSVLVLLGLGCVCLLAPIWAMLHSVALPRGLAMLAGPFGGVWLVEALRLDRLAPSMLVLVGIGLVLFAAFCLWRKPAPVLPSAATVAFLGTAVAAAGAGAAPAGLLHLTLGCLALTAALTSGWPAVLGSASLAGIPPLGVFPSGFDLLTEAASRSVPLALLLAAVTIVYLLAALRHLPWGPPSNPTARLGWLGLALALAGGWVLPPGIAVWLQGIAAAAR